MPRVTMPKDAQAAELVVAGQRVKRGGQVDVDDDTAASLIEQGWTLAGDGLPSKDELVALAEAAGVDVKPSWSKQKIADALAEASDNASNDADTQES